MKNLTRLPALIAMLLALPVAADLDITRHGYITVFDASNAQVSRHTDIKEAYEAISRLAPGTYRIVRPEETVALTLREGESAPPTDLTYTSSTPSGDSIHPGLPAGSSVRVWIVSGTDVRVNTNGSVSAAPGGHSISWAYFDGSTWRTQETIEWVL